MSAFTYDTFSLVCHCIVTPRNEFLGAEFRSEGLANRKNQLGEWEKFRLQLMQELIRKSNQKSFSMDDDAFHSKFTDSYVPIIAEAMNDDDDTNATKTKKTKWKIIPEVIVWISSSPRDVLRCREIAPLIATSIRSAHRIECHLTTLQMHFAVRDDASLSRSELNSCQMNCTVALCRPVCLQKFFQSRMCARECRSCILNFEIQISTNEMYRCRCGISMAKKSAF